MPCETTQRVRGCWRRGGAQGVEETGQVNEREMGHLGCSLVSRWGCDHTRWWLSFLLSPACLAWWAGRPSTLWREFVCFQLHLGVGGVHWYQHRNLPFHGSLSPLGRTGGQSLTPQGHRGAAGWWGSQGRDTGGAKGGERHPREVPSRADCFTACSLLKLCDVQ